MNKNLLEFLACPECGSEDLALLPEGALACLSCAAYYPVKNGIPQMLPTHLAATLAQKDAYLERLEASMIQKKDSVAPVDPETDRFMWEHQLYNWAKRVMYRDIRAARIFESYAEKGARDLCQFIEQRAGGVEGKSLLYVGSGNDRLVSLPLEIEGAFIVNLDIASGPLEDLAESGVKHCVCGDARRLPFRAEAFDVVFSKGSVHHSHPIDEPLLAMARVVKQGGHIIIAEPNKHAIFQLRLPGFLMPSGLAYPSPYENAISARQVMSILARDGISQFQVTALTHAPAGTPSSIARFWERLGRAMPSLFDRFSFEFILHGQKI
ncbi:MAG: methyltransferase domain-containing protein [Dehalococcoidia bacterium]|nr:methyltransferase domain-containing protein [Dehalococcoidia bacterium]